jgi:hypothetical protein
LTTLPYQSGFFTSLLPASSILEDGLKIWKSSGGKPLSLANHIDNNIGDVVTYVAFFFHPVPSTIFSIALVILKVVTPR